MISKCVSDYLPLIGRFGENVPCLCRVLRSVRSRQAARPLLRMADPHGHWAQKAAADADRPPEPPMSGPPAIPGAAAPPPPAGDGVPPDGLVASPTGTPLASSPHVDKEAGGAVVPHLPAESVPVVQLKVLASNILHGMDKAHLPYVDKHLYDDLDKKYVKLVVEYDILHDMHYKLIQDMRQRMALKISQMEGDVRAARCRTPRLC